MEPSWGRRRRPALDGRNYRLTHLLQPVLFLPRDLWPGRARGDAPALALLDERGGPHWSRVEFRNGEGARGHRRRKQAAGQPGGRRPQPIVVRRIGLERHAANELPGGTGPRTPSGFSIPIRNRAPSARGHSAHLSAYAVQRFAQMDEATANTPSPRWLRETHFMELRSKPVFCDTSPECRVAPHVLLRAA